MRRKCRPETSAGVGGGTAQVGGFAGASEYGGGGGLRAARGGAGRDGREGSGGTAGVVWIERAGIESIDSRDVRLDGIDSVFYGGRA